jgi:hypothetical protein
MVSVERVRHSGAVIVSAFVSDGAGVWLLSQRYEGYTLRECRQLFRSYCEDHGLKIGGR